jgi:hypothetical protein
MQMNLRTSPLPRGASPTALDCSAGREQVLNPHLVRLGKEQPAWPASTWRSYNGAARRVCFNQQNLGGRTAHSRPSGRQRPGSRAVARMGLRPWAQRSRHALRRACGGARAAPARRLRHGAAAFRFPEYLSGDQAQKYFADGNNEYQTGPKPAGGFRRELVPNSEARPNSDGMGRHIPVRAREGLRRPENIVLILPDSD